MLTKQKVQESLCSVIAGFKRMHLEIMLKKDFFANMQEIYRGTSMQNCDFNKIAYQLYWNHTSTWVFSCSFSAIFLKILSEKHPKNRFYDLGNKEASHTTPQCVCICSNLTVEIVTGIKTPERRHWRQSEIEVFPIRQWMCTF